MLDAPASDVCRLPRPATLPAWVAHVTEDGIDQRRSLKKWIKRGESPVKQFSLGNI
jgi:hypothetical protein